MNSPLWNDGLSRRERRRRAHGKLPPASPCPDHPEGFVIFTRWADGTEERKCGISGCEWLDFRLLEESP